MAKKNEEVRSDVRLPKFLFIEGLAYWQVPSKEHLELLKSVAERNGWTLQDQGKVKKTGLRRYRITHEWLREQFILEQFAALEEKKEYEEAMKEQEIRHQQDREAMNSLPHLVFRQNICTFTPENDLQIRGLELKSERLGWQYELLPDGVYRICKVRRGETG